MKNIIQKIVISALLPLAALSCRESERLVFDEPASIYFESHQPGMDLYQGTSADSLQYTFLGKPDDFTQAETRLLMMVTGYKTDRPRRINLVPDPQSTLQPGVDYVLPAELVVPANELEVEIPLVFNRTDKLRGDLYWVKFYIEDSEDLKRGYDDYLHFKFIITEKPVRPSNWQNSYYGDYSAAKLRFMYSVLGSNINWGAFPPEHMANSGKLREALARYERDNGPLMGLAEDGEQNIRVSFPG